MLGKVLFEALQKVISNVSKRTMMTTNSGGGSLAIGFEPDIDMGAPVNSMRVPHQFAVRILHHSNKNIRLNGH